MHNVSTFMENLSHAPHEGSREGCPRFRPEVSSRGSDSLPDKNPGAVRPTLPPSQCHPLPDFPEAIFQVNNKFCCLPRQRTKFICFGHPCLQYVCMVGEVWKCSSQAVFDEGFKASTLFWEPNRVQSGVAGGSGGGVAAETPPREGGLSVMWAGLGGPVAAYVWQAVWVWRKGGSGMSSPLNDTPPSGGPIAMRRGGKGSIAIRARETLVQ